MPNSALSIHSTRRAVSAFAFCRFVDNENTELVDPALLFGLVGLKKSHNDLTPSMKEWSVHTIIHLHYLVNFLRTFVEMEEFLRACTIKITDPVHMVHTSRDLQRSILKLPLFYWVYVVGNERCAPGELRPEK